MVTAEREETRQRGAGEDDVAAATTATVAASSGSVGASPGSSLALVSRPRGAVAAPVAPSSRPMAPQQTPREPPRQAATRHRRGAAQRQRRRSLWREPMTAAVLVGTLLVGMLCVYVYAYARVAAAGFEVSRLKRALRRAELDEQRLSAQKSSLQLLPTVAARAKSLGLEPAPAGSTEVIQVTPATPAGAVTTPRERDDKNDNAATATTISNQQ